MSTSLQPSPIVNADPLLKEHAAAAYVGVSCRTLQRWRVAVNPPLSYLRLRGGSIRYRQSVLDNYLNQQTINADAGVKS